MRQTKCLLLFNNMGNTNGNNDDDYNNVRYKNIGEKKIFNRDNQCSILLWFHGVYICVYFTFIDLIQSLHSIPFSVVADILPIRI